MAAGMCIPRENSRRENSDTARCVCVIVGGAVASEAGQTPRLCLLAVDG